MNFLLQVKAFNSYNITERQTDTLTVAIEKNGTTREVIKCESAKVRK